MARSLSRRVFCAACLASAHAAALGRTPNAGTLRLLVPFRMLRLDPHALHDPIAALFGAAIADPLYSVDALGRVYPALAAALPEPVPGGVRVRLRRGLRTARDVPLAARDVIASIERARRRGAAALLANLPAPKPLRGDALGLEFPGSDAGATAAALASPLVAILPREFSPLEPDATGAFAARLGQGSLSLVRNLNAARGASFLDRIEVGPASDLADALRAFESGGVDVGWLGSGLHRARRSAVAFRGMQYGWAILRLGRLGAWAAPGVAQQLLDSVEPGRLRHLGLEGLPPARAGNASFGAGPAEIQVLEDAPQLVLIAKSLAEAVGRPGHELRVAPRSYADIERARSTGDFQLMVDFVRTVGPPGAMTQYALLSAQNPELARRPPRVETFDARVIARSLTLGVIGELWVAGAHLPSQQNLTGWTLANAWQVPERTAEQR